ncbi:uncharacterized protein LOC142767716 [Rhipicephalus microplus]|uniref:uncharacterized protein LOC142767716 n=1 Tax=Rhipicephalus microplus TaxID=6941 RepID=UPI003F6C7140
MAYYETPQGYDPYYDPYYAPYYAPYNYDQAATTSSYTQSTYDPTATATSSVTKDEKVSRGGFQAPSLVITLSAVILFMLIGAVTTLILLTLGTQSSSETTEADYQDISSIPSGGGAIELFVGSKDTQNSTDTEIPRSPATSATVTLPKTTSRRPRVGKLDEPLVCTMGSKTNSTQMFPPDALCDYILYDSLYKGYTNPPLAPSGLDASLATFVDAYATYYTTAFGVGIAYR